MKVEFVAFTRLTLDFHPGNQASKHDGCGISLQCSPNVDASRYMMDNGILKEDGSRVVTNVLVQGLIANIHLAHTEGWKDSAEHLRFIIAELERGFVQPPIITTEKL